MSSLQPIISKRLHDLRTEHHLTQEKLAETLKTTTKTYREWEKKGNIPSTDFLIALSDQYNVSTDYLLGRSECKTIDENIKMINKTIGLSENSIENLKKYDSGFLKILDNLICTFNPDYPDYTGTLEVLLKQLFDYGYRMKTNIIELKTDNLKPQIITDKVSKREFFKSIPLSTFSTFLEIAEETMKGR